MVDDEAEPDDEGNGPQAGMQGESRNRTHGAECEESRVNGNSRSYQGFDVLFEPVDRSGLAFQHEREVGDDGRDANGWHAEHDRLTDAQRLPGAIDRRHQEQNLQRDIFPFQVTSVIGLVDEATMSVPREIESEHGEPQHHPPENSADPFGVYQVRMSIDGVDEGGNADTDGSGARHEHAPREHTSPLPVLEAAFAADDRDPERHEPEAAREDVQHDEALEGEHDLRHP